MSRVDAFFKGELMHCIMVKKGNLDGIYSLFRCKIFFTLVSVTCISDFICNFFRIHPHDPSSSLLSGRQKDGMVRDYNLMSAFEIEILSCYEEKFRKLFSNCHSFMKSSHCFEFS